MSKNLRALTKKELELLNKEYSIEIIETTDNREYVLVKAGYNRIVCHEIGEKFSLNTRVRKLTIQPETVNMWKEQFSNYTLLDVHNAYTIAVIESHKDTIPLVSDVERYL